MVNNQTSCVTVKVITDYDYIYNVSITITLHLEMSITTTGDHVIDYNRLQLPEPWNTLTIKYNAVLHMELEMFLCLALIFELLFVNGTKWTVAIFTVTAIFWCTSHLIQLLMHSDDGWMRYKYG